MATVEEMHFNALGREVEGIAIEISELGRALVHTRPAVDRRLIASRIQGSIRSLRNKLDQQSAELWLLFQDPARNAETRRIQRGIEEIVGRILTLLDPEREAPQTLAAKVRELQRLSREAPEYQAGQQEVHLDAVFWSSLPGRTLESDPWSSLVLLTAVLNDFVKVIASRR